MPEKKHDPERFNSPEYLAVLGDSLTSQVTIFNKNAFDQMQAIAAEGYPNEVCGLLLGCIDTQGWQVHEVRQVNNINTERAAERFQLDPAGYQAIDRDIRGSQLEIIGVFHSHPDCPSKPSPTDLESAWEGFLYPIVSVYNAQVADVLCWAPNEVSKKFHPVHVRKAPL
ncbi:MAG: M67 family metallopeptidase [Mariprofundaceae bacterium]|nr:M67 family metallopeptidase [Mariprofundaceae bacterium]